MSRNEYQPGDVVLTTYGVAVIISKHSVLSKTPDIPEKEHHPLSLLDECFKVRLWRQPGKSIASSASAFLHLNSVSNKKQIGCAISLDSCFN